MADLRPPEGADGWITLVGAVLSTVAITRLWRPLGRWTAKRLDLATQTASRERTDTISRLTSDLQAAREEMVELRQDLAEERELRMAIVVENATLRERVDQLTVQRAEDKRECEQAIRSLRREVAALKGHRGHQS